MDSSPCHSPVSIVTTPSESCSPYPGSRSIHEAVHHSPYMQKPFFSIIIPAYNLENYIAAARRHGFPRPGEPAHIPAPPVRRGGEGGLYAGAGGRHPPGSVTGGPPITTFHAPCPGNGNGCKCHSMNLDDTSALSTDRNVVIGTNASAANGTDNVVIGYLFHQRRPGYRCGFHVRGHQLRRNRPGGSY